MGFDRRGFSFEKGFPMNATKFVIVTLCLSFAAAGWADDKKRSKKSQAIAGQGPATQQEGGRPDQPERGQGPTGGAEFDSEAFAATMVQQFDRDGDGLLNQQELAGCLKMLSEQVVREKQQFAMSMQQQIIGQMNGSGMRQGFGSPGDGQSGQAGQMAGGSFGGSFSAGGGVRFRGGASGGMGGMGGRGGSSGGGSGGGGGQGGGGSGGSGGAGGQGGGGFGGAGGQGGKR
jgi:hypothetical protein